MEQHVRAGNRTIYEWLAALPAFLVLVFVIILNTSHTMHAQLLQLGESVWEGYFMLRHDPVEPSCNLNMDIDTELARIVEERNNQPMDEFDLFAPEPVDPAVMRKSLEAAQAQCEIKYDQYNATKDRITPAVEIFRSVELGVANFGELGMATQRIMLAILVLICGGTALFRRHHIALRPMVTAMDYRVAAGAQFVAFAILFYSVYSFKEVAFSAGIEVSTEHAVLHWLWIFGFGAPLALTLYQMVVIPKEAEPGGNFLKAQLAIPLYATMCLISGTYFILAGHPAGIGIYLNQMMELSQLFLNVGLYVWIGMLLKRTEMAQKVFNIFRPLKLPPEMLAVAVVALAAVPTAYTGGSGIFVIAVGGLIYMELRRAGARRQLALAATAMSGSLGVVLRPCLLVVIVAALNNEVTTDQLFGWGVKVFFLTTVLFAAYALLTRKEPVAIQRPDGNVWPEFKEALKPLIPYVILIAVTLVVYALLLNAYLDEFSAPIILPVLLLVILIYERLNQEKDVLKRENLNIDYVGHRLEESYDDLKQGRDSIEKTIREATTETTGHIGALLMLMGMSVSIGGVIERAEVMTMVPTEFSSIWLAMALLVGILVVIGMVMDPYGAVILVSATIASIAYESGIDPVHFWMVTLVAFELGYLSPPVALNHLLTRQVVGEEEVRLSKEEVVGENFWYRNEKILLPLATMATALLIVAFVPLAIAY
ncbi:MULTISPECIES: TRAP transporter large permease subunit [Thalassolituus]|uniref:TRAP transporter large permease subunit n=1 Tax=Thalassolituus TaxID=187492 RepID=UPI000C4E4A6F|nr:MULTISPECIES: TRAP transporter large permease subunit [Thalassolituus]MAG43473.1 C4-dicarboxylate ABC transporter [Oceanospirillaceae bacterium]MAX87683.1 C4-dicarboxylate ABC transporter [Oceanospirillaceae bacterium]|tara:strand:- start:33023 stop:35149 length:2127 start_codon:yes stop_codon:yes gene_type:complete